MQTDTRISPQTKVFIGLLLLVNILNFIDRQLPFILAEAIRRDLHLSDTQIGLMGGATFAVFYAVVSLPMAQIADRWSAKWTIVACVGVWSAMTALGGFAQNFVQIAACRMGVAVGEAGCTPCSHALISGLVPPRRRALGIGIFAAGTPIGIMIGMALGGWLSDIGSWRLSFILIGAPGIVLALLVAVIAPNKQRHALEAPGLSTLGAIRVLSASRSYRYLVAAMTSFGIAGYAGFAFGAPYFIRVHGLSATQAGLILGFLTGGTGVVGALTGGIAESWLSRFDRRYALYLVAGGFALSTPLAIAAWFASSSGLAVVFLLVPTIFNIFHVGPCYAIAQSLAPSNAKAAASAFPLFGQALVGASVGASTRGYDQRSSSAGLWHRLAALRAIGHGDRLSGHCRAAGAMRVNPARGTRHARALITATAVSARRVSSTHRPEGRRRRSRRATRPRRRRHCYRRFASAIAHRAPRRAR